MVSIPATLNLTNATRQRDNHNVKKLPMPCKGMSAISPMEDDYPEGCDARRGTALLPNGLLPREKFNLWQPELTSPNEVYQLPLLLHATVFHFSPYIHRSIHGMKHSVSYTCLPIPSRSHNHGRSQVQPRQRHS